MNISIFLEKKPVFQTETKVLLSQLNKILSISSLTSVRVFDGFDILNLDDSQKDDLVWQVLGDPVTDELFDYLPSRLGNEIASFSLCIEYLPGQFDQRADSAQQAARLLSDNYENIIIRSFKAYVFLGNLSDNDKSKITKYLLNPVDSRIKNLDDLHADIVGKAESVAIIDDFCSFNKAELTKLKSNLGLSLNNNDMLFIQNYFKEENRDPTETEIRVLDTYWSDHCRHTTFFTELENITFSAGDFNYRLQQSFDDYLTYRRISEVDSRPLTLMDLATINARTLRKQGKLDEVEVSDEINACSVWIKVNVDDESDPEEWLLQFKNETHNHPTEIEPFGGASTCLGGAIRDPLSGRSYVYQAIRVTGSSNPLAPIESTMPGKLPQYSIATKAAKGFSSYGNQIGVASTQVSEIYHPGYTAKRMEIGAVVAASPAENVVRNKPSVGDVIVLLGGKTGRDGCGGASGSSKSHDELSIEKCGAEVQKGNPPVERAIQRLFRRSEVAQKIKKCNDFGAGGVCVAIGELADSLLINLDAVPVKYSGLSGTELTISESQERMAVVLDPYDVNFFIKACEEENTEATVVAEVTENHRLVIMHKGDKIVDLDRDFIESSGAKQTQSDVEVTELDKESSPFLTKKHQFLDLLQSCNQLSQRGLQDMFDSNVGASTVLLPYGGKTQNSPELGSVQLLPKMGATTASSITWGFNPLISSYSPYHGGAYAVVESVCKQIALGAELSKIHLSFQEYFEKLDSNPIKWGKPFSALLGAFSAQKVFELAAIGGKDSMSGSFGSLHVPPTLVSFAVANLEFSEVKTSILQSKSSKLYIAVHKPLNDETPNYAQLHNIFNWVTQNQTKFLSVNIIKNDGYEVEIAKSCLGNRIGVSLFELNHPLLSSSGYGSFIIESELELLNNLDFDIINIGYTHEEDFFETRGVEHKLDVVEKAYMEILQDVYPLHARSRKAGDESAAHADSHAKNNKEDFKENKTPTFSFPTKDFSKKSKNILAGDIKPLVFIPVFPGTNSEYDMQNAFIRGGSDTLIQPFVNLSQQHLLKSIDDFCKALNKSQIFALSGGFSAGDEPNGSGKYIAIILKNQKVREAITAFLARDGLILGICNGFQALVKSGLLPYGEFRDRSSDDITLDHNVGARHVARIASTIVCHTNSPWLTNFNVGDIHQVAFSHGEGRFMSNEKHIEELVTNGQIAMQYVNNSNKASMCTKSNFNGSMLAIEALTSPCGKIFGKMGHSERYTKGTYLNYPDFKSQDIFSAGVNYFK